MSKGTGLFANKGYALVLGAAALWGTSGTLIKYIVSSYDIEPLALGYWRDFLAFMFLLSALCLVKPSLLQLERRSIPLFIGVGVLGLGLAHVFWVYAVTLINVAVATVLSYTAPPFVVIISWLVWREGVTIRRMAALTLTLVGCALVAKAYDLTNIRLDYLGIIMGVGNGLTYALYIILSKRALNRYSPWTVVIYALGLAAITQLALQPLAALALIHSPWQAWLWTIALALFSTVAAFALHMTGLRHLSASAASITATVEPVIAALLGFIVLHETIEALQALGALLVIMGVLLLSSQRDDFDDTHGSYS